MKPFFTVAHRGMTRPAYNVLLTSIPRRGISAAAGDLTKPFSAARRGMLVLVPNLLRAPYASNGGDIAPRLGRPDINPASFSGITVAAIACMMIKRILDALNTQKTTPHQAAPATPLIAENLPLSPRDTGVPQKAGIEPTPTAEQRPSSFHNTQSLEIPAQPKKPFVLSQHTRAQEQQRTEKDYKTTLTTVKEDLRNHCQQNSLSEDKMKELNNLLQNIPDYVLVNKKQNNDGTFSNTPQINELLQQPSNTTNVMARLQQIGQHAAYEKRVCDVRTRLKEGIKASCSEEEQSTLLQGVAQIPDHLLVKKQHIEGSDGLYPVNYSRTTDTKQATDNLDDQQTFRAALNNLFNQAFSNERLGEKREKLSAAIASLTPQNDIHTNRIFYNML